MTPTEKRVLQYLVDRARQAVCGIELGRVAYGLDWPCDPTSEKKYVAVVIYNIRKKLGVRRGVVKRIYNFGYMYLDNTIPHFTFSP